MSGYSPNQLAISPNKNVYASNYGNNLQALPFTLTYTSSSSSYTGNETVTAVATSNTYPNSDYGVAIDNGGNGWITTNKTIFKDFVGSASSYVTYVGSGSFRLLNFDGNNTLWSVDVSNGTATFYLHGGTSAFGVLKPCVVITTTACTTSPMSSPLLPRWIARAASGLTAQATANSFRSSVLRRLPGLCSRM